jgi:hypothetical protein
MPRGPAEAWRHGGRRLGGGGCCGRVVGLGRAAAAVVVLMPVERGRGGEEEAQEQAVGLRGGGGGREREREREDAATQGAPGHVTAARRRGGAGWACEWREHGGKGGRAGRALVRTSVVSAVCSSWMRYAKIS